MIVRDNVGTIEPCLESIRPWVDEMVVVDTGSRDNTPQIAAGFGARVFHFPWCDDFAAARNESLRHACGQWLFWMDSDDTISAENGRKLRELAYGDHAPSTLGYVMQVHCPGPSGASDVTVVDHVKMFRNHPGLRFEFRIHEQVLPSIRRLGGQVAWTDVFAVHSGSDHTPEGKQRKYERDLRILRCELADRRDHPFVLFNVGMTYADMADYELAVGYLQRCLAVSEAGESHVRKAYALLVSSLDQLERWNEALEACHNGRKHFPDDPELLFREGILLHRQGRLDASVAAYHGALADRDQRHFTSVDPAISGYKARHNLALVYNDMGRPDLAEVQWRTAIEEMPDFEPAWSGLANALVAQQKPTEASVLAVRMFSIESLAPLAATLRSVVAAARGDRQQALQHLLDGRAKFPDDLAFLNALCRHYFEYGDAKQAEVALVELTVRAPQDGAARCNLGVVLMRQGKHAEAADCFRQSLLVRPDSEETKRLLAETLAVAAAETRAADLS